MKFDTPPVVEVVCGVQFNQLQEWKSHHYGLFWQTVNEAFPVVEDKAPLLMGLELPLGPATPPKLEFLESFLPRVWFHSEDRCQMIQVQNDRFLFNWRKADNETSYPSFEVVKAQFDQHFSKFDNFVTQAGMALLTPNQYEVTYVNNITKDNGFGELGNDALFTDHSRNEVNGRFLGQTESINLRWTYTLPNDWGRLTAHAQTAFMIEQNNEKIIRFDVTARGWPGDASKSAKEAWFALAHEWITRGFAEMTTPAAHKYWKRTQ